jgi:hypothetical protein
MDAWVSTLQSVATLILPTLIGVGVGSVVIQRFFVSRANQASFIDYLVKELGLLRTDVAEYWTKQSDLKSEDAPAELVRSHALGCKIKADLQSLACDLDHYRTRYLMGSTARMFLHLPKLSKFLQNRFPLITGWITPFFVRQHPALLSKLVEINDICTGGEFETRKIAVDIDRYFKACNAINDLRSVLLKEKL